MVVAMVNDEIEVSIARRNRKTRQLENLPLITVLSIFLKKYFLC
jgi:hypothetical protein